MPEPRHAFLFDGERCTGCEACRLACGMANAGGADTGWRRVLTFNPRRHPALATRHLSLACNHCDDPACLAGCPAAAYRRDPATGAVLLEQTRCLGCRYCSWVCPYDAPRFDAAHGVMAKCTWCATRLRAGGEPACTQACPTGALSWGERTVVGRDDVYPGVPDTKLGPALVVAPPRRPLAPPPTVPAPPTGSFCLQPAPARKITLQREWSLVVFTTLMPALAAWWTAGLLRPERAPSLLALLGLGAVALGVSWGHLGRPLRAWRALANLCRSWLSREVAAATALLGLGAASLLVPRGWSVDRPLGWAAALAGAGLVVAIDGVYRRIPRLRPVRLDGGEATLGASFLLAVLVGAWSVAAALGVGRSMLALRRLKAGEGGLPGVVVTLRAALMAVACLPLLPWPVAAGVALLGEAIDRGDLLLGLEPVSPELLLTRQTMAALEA